MMHEASAPWFVVVPDRMEASAVVARLRPSARQMVPHASGRPWLVGSWPHAQMRLASAGSTSMAVAGTCSLTAGQLATRLKAVRNVGDVESAVRALAGSFHVVATVDGHGYIRGSAFGVRRLYATTIEGVTVCADRARTLAWLIGAPVDPARLAARLVSAMPPLPDTGSMWRGVREVPQGQALRTEPDGSCRDVTWWQPPQSALPLTQGASALRNALRDAVAVRVTPGRVLGADLSGGMDSTSICFLAAEAGAHLVTATLHWSAPGNQDPHYADYAAARLPHVTPLAFPPGELPAFFTGLHERHDPADEPSALLRDRVQQARISDAMRARGAVIRLSGHGGDHAVTPPTQYLHDLLRRRPAMALRHTAGWRARRRWPLSATTRMLFDSDSYPRWLHATARGLREPAPPRHLPPSWGNPPQLPAWASEHATALLADVLRTAAPRAQPLACDRTRHSWIAQGRQAGRSAGQVDHAATAAGLPAHSPFCDDAVINACLAVVPEQASDPWSYKPLLAAAMRGIVPEHLLRRVTKDHSGQEWYSGLHEHRRDLADWAEDSHLAAAGIVDRDALRRVLDNPGLLDGNAAELEHTLGTEAWMRDLAARPTPDYLDPIPVKEHPVEPTSR